MRMLVTRPEPDATDTARRLEALDIEPVLCPLLQHRTLQTSLPDPKGFAALALTSANALRALDERGLLQRYQALPVVTVGERTAARARDLGFIDVRSAGGSFADLVQLLVHAGFSGPVLYPAPRQRSGDLGKSLASHGIMVITAEIYEMAPVGQLPEGVLESLAAGWIEAALFYSRRTAETFVALAGSGMERRVKAGLGVLCISETVAEPLIESHFVRVGLADHPSEEAMMSLALSFARDQNAS